MIDEVSMLGPTFFEKLESLARTLRRNESFFGGLTVLLVGDFYQLPPVDDDRFLFESALFRREMKVVGLETIYRQKHDLEWYGLLQNLRRGTLTDKDSTLLHSRLLEDSMPTATATSTTMTVLYPINRKVDALNKESLFRLGTPVRSFPVRVVQGKHTKPIVDVAPLCQRMGVVETIYLAKGAQVMLTWNMDVEAGLVNGSQGVVTNYSRKGWPMVKFVSLEEELEIEPKEYSEDDGQEVKLFQLPLKLAWALSIHKVQGHNLDAALMDLGSQVFECGQAYVALSRIKTLEGVYLSSLDVGRIQAHPAVVAYYDSL
jgi:ATP-dependent DNA helicase PIF1